MTGLRIDPAATIGAVHLTVSDLDRSVGFYRDRIGLPPILGPRGFDPDGRPIARFERDGSRDLLVLTEVPGARREPHATGLYHFAILVPSRRDLAFAFRRLAEAGQRFTGFSDHLVSEALYLADPDGNGIEIYRDRPRDEWPREADGSVRMDNLPLDLDGMMGELRGGGADQGQRLPSGTRIGHVHLQVADVKAAEAFYTDVIGMDVTARYGSSASFIAADRYHHHVGVNTWASLGASPPPPGSVGLRHFEIVVPNRTERDRIADRAARAGGPIEEMDGGIRTLDPSGNGIVLVAATGGA
jgi:catechol 2,3-dioxygenase